MLIRGASPHLIFLFLLVCTTQSRLVNIVIDDTYGDLSTGQKPVYQPWPGPWYNSTHCAANGCSDVSSPNTSLAIDGTWTAGLYDSVTVVGPYIMNITLSFTGISIWIFFILPSYPNPPAQVPVTPETACNFTLDGTYMGYFIHAVNRGEGIQYNTTIFNVIGLNNSQHELVISTEFQGQAYVIFDYAVYTADIPDNTTSLTSIIGSSSTATIVHPSSTQTAEPHISSSNRKLKVVIGSALGVLGLIVLLMALAFRFRHSRRVQKGIIEPVLAMSFNRQSLVGGVMTGNTTDLQQQNFARNNENSGPSEEIIPDQHDTIPSHSFDSTGIGPATVVPFRQFQLPRAPDRKGQDELRAMRQMEINQHLQSAQQEMQDLTSRQSAMRSETGHGHDSLSSSDVRRQETEREMEIMREQIRHLNTRMENLHMQLSSDWAQGLSDEPPPAYY